MNTVIVPVDFSETSLNAANYAAQLLTGHYGVTMVSYHSYNEASEPKTAAKSLEKLKGELKDFYSIRINDTWRIIFKWENPNSELVKIINYH